jgi:hypothetical protein
MSEIEELARAYAKKYNDGPAGEDATEVERNKYSCDGCWQNGVALKSAYLAGALALLGLAEGMLDDVGARVDIDDLRALVGEKQENQSGG